MSQKPQLTEDNRFDFAVQLKKKPGGKKKCSQATGAYENLLEKIVEPATFMGYL